MPQLRLEGRNVVSPIVRIPPSEFLKHILIILFFFSGWKSLNYWYLYQDRNYYLIFAAFILFAISLAFLTFRFNPFKKISKGRIGFACFLLLLMLPWGEWLNMNFPIAREDWSRQLLKQTIFIYVCFLLFRIFPVFPKIIHTQTIRILDFVSSKTFLLWLPCVLFFILSTFIAIFVFQKIPMVQDTAAHLFQAKILLDFKLFAPTPPVPDFFSCMGDMLVMKGNRWFGMYPPGFALLLAPAILIRAEWFLCPLLGTLTLAIWLMYIKRWHGKRHAALFSWLFLFSPFIFLMSSTIMVHTPELFVASATIYLCRSQLESASIGGAFGLFFLMVASILIRGYSLLPFLLPVLCYSSWQHIKTNTWHVPIFLIMGIFSGLLLLGLYQWKTTGNPFVSGYSIEYPDYKYGFGKAYLGRVHTPAKGLGNTSNNVLGLNRWLTGWYSGSMFFLITFVLFGTKRQNWDLVLGLCCVVLATFYYFFVAQDLIFGPRWFYAMAPVILFMIARNLTQNDETNSSTLHANILALLVISFITFLPVRFSVFLKNYLPQPHLKNQMQNSSQTKTLIFLDNKFGENYVNWNDPFFRDPAILCRDLKSRNTEAIAAFPDYRPTYFRSSVNFKKKEINYGLFKTPENTPPGFVSLFELTMALHAPKDEPDKDIFDITYRHFFTTSEASIQLKFLEQQALDTTERLEYRKNFRLALIHAGRMLLLPKAAFEQENENWLNAFDVNDFRNELNSSLNQLKMSGEIGKEISVQIEKVKRRIDQNQDEKLSDEEIKKYLSQKILHLYPD